MDEKGFIFTFDAALALIPIFILLLAVNTIDSGNFALSSEQMRLSHQAQDCMDLMAQYQGSSGVTVINEIVSNLAANDNNDIGVKAAAEVAGGFLDKNLPGKHYKLVELKQLNGATIASNGQIEDAKNVAVASRSYGNYNFLLYVWDA